MSSGFGAGAALRSRCLFLSSSRSAAALDSGVSSGGPTGGPACASWDGAGAEASSARADEPGWASDPCSVPMTVSACCAAACKVTRSNSVGVPLSGDVALASPQDKMVA